MSAAPTSRASYRTDFLMPGRDRLTAAQTALLHAYLAGDVPTVIGMDLDNTLLKCTEAYVEQNTAFVAEMRRRFPHLDEATIATRFDAIDVGNKRTMGVSVERYPSSMVQALEEFAAAAGVRVTDDDRAIVYDIGAAVFRYEYPPFPGTLALLRALKDAGARLALCTKGDPLAQNPKLERWGLRDFFGDAIIIRDKKAKEPIDVADALAAAHPLGRPEGFFVGDSLRDDIQSANAIGAISVHKPYTGARAWSYEDGFDHIIPVFRIPQITDLPLICPVPGMAWPPQGVAIPSPSAVPAQQPFRPAALVQAALGPTPVAATRTTSRR